MIKESAPHGPERGAGGPRRHWLSDELAVRDDTGSAMSWRKKRNDALSVRKGQGLRVHTNQDRATLPHDMVDPRRGPVGPVAQQEIPAAARDTAGRLAPVDIGQLEEVALQVGQIDDRMDTPICARSPLFLDGRGVDGPDAIPGVDDRRRGSVPQLLRQPPQPLFGGLEPLEYGDR